MSDVDCVEFLQWALPRMGYRWPGFRKVRRQVCKRIRYRMAGLGLEDFRAYRGVLERRTEEWPALDAACRITISRFYRDRGVFEQLGREVLPALAESSIERGESCVRGWSAGCASGEEPYTVSILWELLVRPAFPELRLALTATDADSHLLQRARRAVYGTGSVKELPDRLRREAFDEAGSTFRLMSRFTAGVELECQDIRERMPPGPFDLVLCRNLPFTYFDEPLQLRTLRRLVERLAPGGVLAIGRHESLPAGGGEELSSWSGSRALYRRSGAHRDR